MTIHTGLPFDPTRLPAPVRLARTIATDIMEEAVPVGTRLGSLPQVAARYGVSVPTLRKAITYLVEDGFVLSREGRGGGLVVAAPPDRSALRAMRLFFSNVDLSDEHIVDARELIAVALAERACRLVDDADQRELEACFAEARKPGCDARALIGIIDRALLAAAKQPVLALVSDVVSRLELERIRAPAPNLELELALRLEAARAIIGGNLAGALELRLKFRPIAGSEPALPEEEQRTGRLSEQVAASVRTIIKDRALAPGDEIGSERELQDLFAVGRNTLRDALRPLEQVGAIKVANGRGGGIFVGAAEPYAAVEMVALYLSSVRLTFAEQIESRQVLESRAAWLAAERISPDLRSALERAAADEARAVESDLAAWSSRGTHVERLVANACRNPVLEFFTLVLIELSMLQGRRQATARGVVLVDLARLVSAHHTAIVEAILRGYPAKAAFKTRQLLRDLDDLMRGVLSAGNRV